MEKAEKQINIHRKGDFVLTFRDAEGGSINAQGVIDLKSHDFDFGANLFGFHKMEGQPLRELALRAIDTLFNTVIVCDYWNANQPELQGGLYWASPDYGFETAAALDKKARYHALIFGFPRWFHHYETEEELWEVIDRRIKNVADRYGDRIVEVDVINEFINYQYWDQNSHAQYLNTTAFPDFANAENGARVLQIARKHMPGAKLVVLETNLWSISNPVFQEIYQYHKSLIELGAPYDYIGYQAHYYAQKGMPFEEGTPEFGPRTFMMDEISRGLEQMAKLGKPMVITEFNPPSRNNRNSDPDQPRISDEEIAAWEKNFYTLLFSKPYIDGLSRWFTIDNLGGRGMDAGVVSEEGGLKPNYYALKELIKETWHTRWEGLIKEEISFKGFHGTYKVSVEGYQETTIQLVEDNSVQEVILQPY
jgi:endo-1,4-beta-xylanase